MITQAQYIARVKKASKNPQHASSVKLALPTAERKKSLKDSCSAFGFDWKRGRSGIVEIHHLHEAKEALERPDFDIQNWHYDRTTECLLINLELGVHEHLSSSLYQCYVGPDAGEYTSMKKQAEYAERFIEQGLGWFRSTASYGRAMKGSGVVLNAQERAVFKSVGFVDM